MPNKKKLHIVDSYKWWHPAILFGKIFTAAYKIYGICGTKEIETIFNRSLKSMYIEWWAHNIGYYLTLPLCKIPYFKALNNRFKDVDLEEWKK